MNLKSLVLISVKTAFIYLKSQIYIEREMHYHLLTHYPKALNGVAELNLVWNSTRVSQMNGRDPTGWAITAALLGLY